MALTKREYQEIQAKATKKQAQLSHVLLDCDFYDKPKIKALFHKFGNDGVSFLIRILMAMSRATDGCVGEDCISQLGHELKIHDCNALHIYFLENGLLERSGKVFTNSRVLEDQAKLAKRRSQTKQRVDEFRVREKEAASNALQQRYPDTDTEYIYNNISNKDKQGDNKGGSETQFEAPTDEFEAKALEKLEIPGDQPWTRETSWVTAGRRPMRRFKEIYLSTQELADVFKQWTRAQIPEHKFAEGFKKARARLTAPNARAGPVAVYSWLIGWVKQELLDEVLKEAKLERELSYANRQ
jgi:hypothetical protein